MPAACGDAAAMVTMPNRYCSAIAWTAGSAINLLLATLWPIHGSAISTTVASSSPTAATHGPIPRQQPGLSWRLPGRDPIAVGVTASVTSLWPVPTTSSSSSAAVAVSSPGYSAAIWTASTAPAAAIAGFAFIALAFSTVTSAATAVASWLSHGDAVTPATSSI